MEPNHAGREVSVSAVEGKAPAYVEVERFLGLQILRFAAAACILLFNIGNGLTTAGRQRTNQFEAGALAVDIFFVLSGFVIAYAARPEQGTRQFLIRRLARIGPLYWLLTTGLVGIALLAPTMLSNTAASVETTVRSYLFIPYGRDNGLIQPLLFIGWTLCYEMAFYILFGLCLSAGHAAPWLACLVLSLAALAGWIWTDGSVLWRFYTSPVILEFGFGIVLWRLHAGRLGSARGTPQAAALAFGAFLLFALQPGLPHVAQDGLVATLIVAACLWLPPLGGACVAVLVALGDASYALYLSHPFVLQATAKILWSHPGIGPVALTAMTVALALPVALILNRFVERPAQAALIRRLGRPVPRLAIGTRTPGGALSKP